MRRPLLFVIRVASILVPSERREGWRKEWRGEVVHALEGEGETGPGVSRRARLLLRTCWCLADALWIRMESLPDLDLRPRPGAAWRSLRRSPGLTVLVVLTLATSIGASTAIFSVAYGVLLRPLPFPGSERLGVIWAETRTTGGSRIPVDAPDVALIREHARAFEGVSFVRTVTDGTLTGRSDAESVALARVSGDFFRVLGVGAELGRTLEPGDGRLTPEEAARDDDDLTPLPPTVVVLSHDLWIRRFGEDPEILGRTVEIDGDPAVVVGVMPPGFRVPMPAGSGIPSRVDAWTSVRFDLALLRRRDRLEDQDSRNAGVVVARRRGGVSPDVASEELAEVSALVRRRSSAREAAGFRLVLEPLRDEVGRGARPVLLALLGGAGLVVLIGCLNVAGLLLARSLVERRGRAVRAALGAGQRRLAVDALTEAGVLALLGGGAGLGLAAAGTPWLAGVLPEGIPRLSEVAVNLPVLAFAGLTTVLAVLVFGTLPALRAARVEPAEALVDDRGGEAPAATRAGGGLVGGQIALVTMLVMGSALLVETVRNLREAELGFRPEEVVAFDLSLVFRDGYRGPADRALFLRRLERRLSRLPGVREVGTTGVLPLSEDRFVQPYALPGAGALGADPERRADFRVVTPGYFRAAGTRVLAGRSLVPADDDQDSRVVVGDAALARRLSRDGEPASAVGKVIRIPLDGEEVRAEIVGIVESARQEDLRSEGRPAIYVPYRHEASRNVSVVLRTDGASTDLARAIRREIRDLDPRLAAHDWRTLEELVARELAPIRFLLTALTAFGVLSLTLAAMGVFGLVAYEVRRRRRDIGVRVALGASRGSLLRGVLVRSLTLGGAGMGAGVAAALAASRALDAVVYGVDAGDPRLLGLVSLVVLGTTSLASWLPAREAAGTSPMEVLRTE